MPELPSKPTAHLLRGFGPTCCACAHTHIKVLEKKRMVQAEDIERVGREIAILKMLKHPNVIRCPGCCCHLLLRA